MLFPRGMLRRECGAKNGRREEGYYSRTRRFRSEGSGLRDCCWGCRCGVVGDGGGDVDEGGVEDGGCCFDRFCDVDCYLVGDEDGYFVGSGGGDGFGPPSGAGGER